MWEMHFFILNNAMKTIYCRLYSLPLCKEKEAKRSIIKNELYIDLGVRHIYYDYLYMGWSDPLKPDMSHENVAAILHSSRYIGFNRSVPLIYYNTMQ